MPHITIEHSHNIVDFMTLQKLSSTLHNHLATLPTISKAAIKTRTIEAHNVLIGEDETENFVHITILLLSGRDATLKETIAKSMFACAQNIITSKIPLSVEIRELGTYIKA